MPLAENFVPLDHTQHDLKGFDCGKAVMNDYLVRFAARNMRLGLNRTWILADSSPETTKSTVAAYYTLASSTVQRQDIPTDKALPRYPLPVILLARLAVNLRYAGHGLGEKTLITSIRKSVELTEKGLPAMGMAVDVLDAEALTFYQRFEIFEPFTDDPMRLFVPMGILKQI